MLLGPAQHLTSRFRRVAPTVYSGHLPQDTAVPHVGHGMMPSSGLPRGSWCPNPPS